MESYLPSFPFGGEVGAEDSGVFEVVLIIDGTRRNRSCLDDGHSGTDIMDACTGSTSLSSIPADCGDAGALKEGHTPPSSCCLVDEVEEEGI